MRFPIILAILCSTISLYGQSAPATTTGNAKTNGHRYIVARSIEDVEEALK